MAAAGFQPAKSNNHISSKFIISRQITHLPNPGAHPRISPALSFKQEPVSFPLTAGHYAAATRVSAACQSFTNGRFSRHTQFGGPCHLSGLLTRVGARSTY